MTLLLAFFYVVALAALVRFVAARPWPLARRGWAIGALLAAVPAGLLLMLLGQPAEQAWWGAGLILVSVVPANLLGALGGGLWHRLDRRRTRG